MPAGNCSSECVTKRTVRVVSIALDCSRRRIWNTTTGLRVAELPAPGHTIDGGLAYAPNGHTLAISTVDDITLWDTSTWRVRSTLQHTRTSTYDPNYHGPVGGIGRYALAFAPDSRSLATVQPDAITVWDTTSHSKIASLVQYGADFTDVAFGRDRHTIVAQSGSDYIAL